MTAKTLETAISKVAALPEPVQERLGHELLRRIEGLETLRADIEIGIAQLDAGLGEELDMDELLETARREHETR